MFLGTCSLFIGVNSKSGLEMREISKMSKISKISELSEVADTKSKVHRWLMGKVRKKCHLVVFNYFPAMRKLLVMPSRPGSSLNKHMMRLSP